MLKETTRPLSTSLEVLFAPAEFAALERRDLSGAVCVVFDVLRATSSMVTALANGAAAIVPVITARGLVRGGPDERAFAVVRRLRLAQPGARLTLAEFKAMVREQYFMLLIDPEAALNAIPAMLPEDAEERRSGFAAVRQVLAARGEIGGEAKERLERVRKLFGVDEKEALEPSLRQAS